VNGARFLHAVDTDKDGARVAARVASALGGLGVPATSDARRAALDPVRMSDATYVDEVAAFVMDDLYGTLARAGDQPLLGTDTLVLRVRRSINGAFGRPGTCVRGVAHRSHGHAPSSLLAPAAPGRPRCYGLFRGEPYADAAWAPLTVAEVARSGASPAGDREAVEPAAPSSRRGGLGAPTPRRLRADHGRKP
jgi:hypothetical protein